MRLLGALHGTAGQRPGFGHQLGRALCSIDNKVALTWKLPLILLTLTVAAKAAAQVVPVANAGAVVPPDRSPVFRVVIAPEIFETLDELADTLGVETVRCLIGVMLDSAYIDLAWEPPIELSTPRRVRYRSCPSATLALWHNHTWASLPQPEYACYLSALDIREALKPNAPLLQIVQVSSSVACWWTVNQIARARDEPILWPLPSQRRGRDVTLASACGRARTGVPCVVIRSCDEAAARPKVHERVCREVVIAGAGSGDER